MIPADKPAFIEQLVGLAAIKPGKPLTSAAYEIWWTCMQAWSLDDFKQAAAHLARSVEFMPSPFHFEQLRKAGRPTAGEAWARVLDYIRHDWSPAGPIINGGNSKPIDDLADRAVRAIGGYGAIAMSPTDKTHFLEQRFAQHYESMQDAQDIRDAVPRIAGPEANNRRVVGPNGARDLLARWTPPQDDSHEN